MFFLRMIFRSFSRQFKRRLLIAVTVCLSATVSVAMLGVVFDVGDKLNAELSTYGSNITVQPKADAVVSDLYNTGGSSGSSSDSDPTAFLKESDAPKIKTIFWAFNITNFAPELNIHVDAGCSDGSASADSCKATNVPIVGTWFAKTLHIDSIDKIEVKALTTPDNDLARKASKNPNALTQDEWETWYCTAYPSSIAYQIEEVIPGSVAKQVRQVAALQGDVLQKTQAVMVLMTVLSLVAAAIAVANLMAASIGERGSELALMKAIGATDGAVSRLMLAETAVISLVGALVGALFGSGVAQIVGHVVFGSGITMRPMVFVLVFVLLAVTVLIASFSSIRSILNLKPAEVLHGR